MLVYSETLLATLKMLVNVLRTGPKNLGFTDRLVLFCGIRLHVCRIMFIKCVTHIYSTVTQDFGKDTETRLMIHFHPPAPYKKSHM